MSFWEDLVEVSEKKMGRWCNELMEKIEMWKEEEREVSEEVWQDWLIVHNEVAEAGIGYQKARKKKGERKMKMSKEIVELVNKKNKLREMMAQKQEGDEKRMLREEHRTMKVKLKNMVRKEKRKREKEWSKELEKVKVGDSREYWTRLRNMTGLGKGGREVPNEMRKGEGLVKGEEALGVWRESFEKLGRADGGDDRYDREFWQETREMVEEWGKQQEVEEGELDEEITPEEVKKAMKELRRGKAPGVDGVVNEVLMYGGDAMERALYMMFNVFFREERVPVDWTRGLVVPLYKDGDRHVGDNYRGITLLSVVGKLYTVVLNRRLSQWCEKKGVLVDEQAGFRVNRSTIDQIYALREVIQGRRRKRLNTYCCFLDIKKAYDTVFREGLWRRLREVGVRGKMWRALKNIYVKVESSVVVNEVRTDWFELFTGVRQGCILSPTLFAIFINGLATLVKDCTKGAKLGPVELHILLFADDIVLVADKIQDLQHMLYVADEYSRMYRFGFNGSKSNVVVFSGRQEEKIESKIFLGSLVLEQKTSYKYLGLELDRQWKWGKVKERMIEKARKRIAGLCGAGIKQGLSVSAAVRGWEVLVRPVMEYGCEIWGEKRWKEAEELQTKLGRRILGVSRKTAGAAVLGELGWWRMEARRDLARLRFWGKLVRMEASRIVRRIYDERRRMMYRGRGRGDGGNWLHKTRTLLVELGLGEVWESQQVGTKQQWGAKLAIAIAKREEKWWAAEVKSKPKLRTYLLLKPKLSFELYLNCGDSWRRSLMTKLRVGTNFLNIELGRWEGKPLAERICNVCLTKQVEDEQHFLVDCPVYKSIRDDLFKDLKEEKYDVTDVINDKKKLMNALIGEGLPGRTERVVEIVMKYIDKLFKIRKKFAKK